MTEREINIIESAFSVFSRYGVKRTGMNDIARAAGISRQTLYNVFSNKDEVLRGTIRLFTDRAIQEIEQGLLSQASLGAQLDLIFEHIALRPYALIHASPNAEDIIQGMNAASRDEIESSNERFRAVIESILSPYKSIFRKSKIAVIPLSDLIQRSASAMKQQARDEAHLQELLDSLKKAVLRCTA